MIYSEEMESALKRSKEIAKKLNNGKENTGHILMALYENSDTICHFLFKEDQIIMDDILKAYYEINNDIEENIDEVLAKAKEEAKKYNSKKIYDEYIFYIFLTSNCVANNILKKLNIDSEQYIEDTLEIMNVDNKNNSEKEYPFLINLSNNKSSHKYVKYKDYIKRITYILAKKNKHNPLLIGNPGVGKTALVEGLAKLIETPVYQLDIGGTVAKTKYRGELEEKIIKTMNYIIDNEAILFIDEIHTIVNSANSESALDIANILKPYLTNPRIKIIGATTLEEYYNFIEKDKALSRRFNNLFIDEPNSFETKKIINGVIKDFEKYHNLKYSKDIIDKVIKYADIYLPNRTFPDKALDILDELGARKVFPLDKSIKNIIKDYTGIKTISISKIKELKLNYPSLLKYYNSLIYLNSIKKENIVLIKTHNNFDIKQLIKDLEKVFQFKKEAYLELDLELFQDYTMINNLIGSSKGYVGYNEGGILCEHILKYPMCLIFFRNLDKCHYQIEYYIRNIFTKNYLIDNKNRKIYLTNCIFVYSVKDDSSKIGLINTSQKKNYPYDITI